LGEVLVESLLLLVFFEIFGRITTILGIWKDMHHVFGILMDGEMEANPC
jgi:hypothetical protein